MSKPLQILIVEDSEDDAELLLHTLRHAGFQFEHNRVDTLMAMKAALAKQSWDLVISDYTMPDFSGPAALKLLKESGLDLPFILVSGSIGEETAVDAMRLGAHDYILKDNLTRLGPAIERELREAEVRRGRKQAEEKIKQMAYYDSLTNFPNRAQLRDLLQEAILAGQAANKPIALLFIDLKHFREVNDALGRNLGDSLLQQVGPRLRAISGEADRVAHLGGDEFSILLPGRNREEAIQAARQVHKTMEEPFVVGALALEVGVSVGIALWPEHGPDMSALMEGADAAMYMAKGSDNGYVVFTPEQDQANLRRLSLMGELRRAIEENQLFPQFQPKLDLKTGRVIGVETLVRWKHPHLGVIPPDQFIMLAEYTGLIRPLTFWVLSAALLQCDEWCQSGLSISVAVNLSARNLQDPQLLDRVEQILHSCGITANLLELEITESVIMSDPLRAMDTLTRLNKMGIKLSIDDFGTGYSSLGYLKKLPVDEVKIDKSFVKEMASNKDDAVIVRSTIDLAHNLGLKVVAEGVENQATLDHLISLGCDLAQGYYISRPVSAVDLARWLTETAPLKGWKI